MWRPLLLLTLILLLAGCADPSLVGQSVEVYGHVANYSIQKELGKSWVEVYGSGVVVRCYTEQIPKSGQSVKVKGDARTWSKVGGVLKPCFIVPQ